MPYPTGEDHVDLTAQEIDTAIGKVFSEKTLFLLMVVSLLVDRRPSGTSVPSLDYGLRTNP